MIQYKDALSFLRQQALVRRERLKSVEMPVADAMGCILSHAVVSPEDLPSFNNSAMDGFAIRSTQTPIELTVEHSIAAGDPAVPLKSAANGVCYEIMTGARLPPEMNAVVKIEDVEVFSSSDGKRRIRVRHPVKEGENLRMAGEDFRRGQEVAMPGDRLGLPHLMAMSALGVGTVSVFRPLKIALISTGKELVETGSIGASQIRNSTAPYVMGLLKRPWVVAHYHGIVADEPSVFMKKFRDILATEPDVVITTGAVSVGKYDFVGSTLKDLGAQILFHKVAMRPGKPILFATLQNGPVIFGLPGNPVSTAVGMRFFVEPYLQNLLTAKQETIHRARLTANATKPEGLRCFFKAHVAMDAGSTSIHVLPGQASFMIHPLLKSNAWAILPESGTEVSAGELIEFVPLWNPLLGTGGV